MGKGEENHCWPIVVSWLFSRVAVPMVVVLPCLLSSKHFLLPAGMKYGGFVRVGQENRASISIPGTKAEAQEGSQFIHPSVPPVVPV